MRSALEISYGDRAAAFDLCWQMSMDPSEILNAIPEKREVLAAYLAYVLSHHKQDAIAGAASRLARTRSSEDVPLLYTAIDNRLSAGDAGEASDLWQALGNPRPTGVTHPDFEQPRIGHGFDWIYPETQGVGHVALDLPPAHRIRFSGQQPESCELLRQVVGGLRMGAEYTLHWDARTQGIASPTGLQWRIAGRSGDVAASGDWSQGSLAFKPESDHATLQLVYRRPEGQARTDGQIDLKRVVISSPE